MIMAKYNVIPTYYRIGGKCPMFKYPNKYNARLKISDRKKIRIK